MVLIKTSRKRGQGQLAGPLIGTPARERDTNGRVWLRSQSFRAATTATAENISQQVQDNAGHGHAAWRAVSKDREAPVRPGLINYAAAQLLVQGVVRENSTANIDCQN